MYLYKKTNYALAVSALVLTFFYFSSCEDKVVVEPYMSPPVNEQQSRFFLSWIAEVTSDTAMIQDSVQGLTSLTALGSDQITAAITNPILVAAFGDYGSAPVWGPALSVSVVGDTAVLTDNLMYAVKSVTGTEVTYTIAVSGTNAISAFDWFAEDFDVNNTIPWPISGKASIGNISKGSALGLETLLKLENATNTDIIDFIKNELRNGDPAYDYAIEVTGHSLGGALSPLLALYLKQVLSSTSYPVSYSVEAWPYAGPTPGDTTFANYLVETLDAYHAFNNSYDLVPHVWELDSLERLCDLYLSDEAACGYNSSNANIANGFVQWAIGLSDSSGIDYQIAGTPNTFDGGPLPLNETLCGKIAVMADSINIGKSSTYQGLKFLMESMDVYCGDTAPKSDLQDNIAYFLLYFQDIDYQHTTAYELQYFPDTLVMANVDAYFPSGTDELTYMAPIIVELLSDVLDQLSKRTSSDCQCQT